MENNFIQMAASADHPVAVVFHQWLNEYCPLKRQLSLACQRIVKKRFITKLWYTPLVWHCIYCIQAVEAFDE